MTEPPTSPQNQNVNLMVALRIRPMTPDEKTKGATQVAYRIDDRMVVLLDPGDNLDDVLRQKRTREKRFVFDVAFGPEATQEEVYERTTKHLIENVVNGYNATVFAYGATGAGKTFTMIGTESNVGIMARALNDLFKKIQHNEEHSSYAVKISYLEIYNEMIRDLLQPSSGYLDVREDSKGGIQVVGLTETSTTSPQDVMQLLMEGNKRRTQEPTSANKTSSRSHAILQVTVTQKSRVKSIKSVNHVGRLFMIDLAGSERASVTQNTGQRLKEGAHINRSLLALGNVINTLAEKGAKYVNYRDSKLTRLLKDSLGGNSRTIMIANISPTSAQFEESRNTLIYADRAKNISNKIMRNNQDVSYHVTQYQQIISELRKEISRLKAKIDEQNGLPSSTGLMRSESALSFLRDKQSIGNDGGIGREDYATTDHLPRINHGFSKGHPLSGQFYQLKDEMDEIFKTQMQLRQKLLQINEKAFDAALALSDKRREFNEEVKENHSNKTSNQQTPLKLRRDIEILEKKLKDLDHQRAEVEWDLSLNQKKAKKLEETLPQKISADEEKEMINFYARLHAAEAEKLALQSDAMILQKRLKRQENSLQRLRDYHQMADQVITAQQDLIHVSHLEYPSKLKVAMDDYRTKRRSAEVILEPLDTRSSIMGKGSWNKANLDRDRALYEQRTLNKTLNASELQALKQMASMLERERSNVSEPAYSMHRPGSAGNIGHLPIVNPNTKSLNNSPMFTRPRTMTGSNLRRASDISLMDIRSVARERRTALGNNVSWKNPVAVVALTPENSSFNARITDSPESGSNSITSPPGQPLKKLPVKRHPRAGGQLTPIGVPSGPVRNARNGQRRSRSRRRTRSSDGVRRNSASPHLASHIPTPSERKLKANPNRRIRSPTQPRLPVIKR